MYHSLHWTKREIDEIQLNISIACVKRTKSLLNSCEGRNDNILHCLYSTEFQYIEEKTRNRTVTAPNRFKMFCDI